MDQKLTDKTTLTIVNIIKAVIIDELHALIYPSGKKTPDVFLQTSPYIKFLPLISCFEFLGACYDELPFETTRIDKQDIVETRFNKALKALFDKKYLPYIKADNKFYLYKNLRCAMIHQLRPGPGIYFTTRREAIEDGNKHLILDKEGNLILVLEDLYDDLFKAGQKIIRLFENKKLTNKKGEMAFIDIVKY